MPIMRTGPAFLSVLRPVVFASLAVLAFIGCGSGDPEELVFDFDDVPEDPAVVAPQPTYDPFSRLVDHSGRESRLTYLHDIWAMSRELEETRRHMVRLIEVGREEPVDVDWVVRVHTQHQFSEELRIRAYRYPISEDLVEDYLDFHAAFLEAVQVYSYGADRLLSGAILVGPAGETSADLYPVDQSEFMSLLGEANFYMADAEVLLVRTDDDLGEIFRSLRVR